MLLTQILLILRARHWLIWLPTLVALAVSAYIATGLEKKYVATAEILIDVREPDALTARSQGASSIFGAGYLGTQNDIIRSARVMRKVVDTMGLTTNAQAVEQWRKAKTESPIDQYYAEILRGYMEVIPSRSSNVLAIRFSSPSPTFAASAANTVARVYMDTSIELRTEPARTFAKWFQERTRSERLVVEQAQEKLSQFQRENGIVGADERSDVESARLNEINAQLTTLQAQRADSSTRALQARGDQATSPDIVNHSAVAGLRSEVYKLEAKLEELGRTFGPSHPTVIRAQAELDAMRTRLEAATATVISTVGTTDQIILSRQAKLAEALAAQKSKVLKQRELRDKQFLLQRELESAQRMYELVASRLAQTSLDSQVDQTNLVLLTEARAPLAPSAPNVPVIVLVWTVVGALTGAVIAVLVELLRPRLRTAEEAAGVLQLPVLVSLTGARRRRPRWTRLKLPRIFSLRSRGTLPGGAAT